MFSLFIRALKFKIAWLSNYGRLWFKSVVEDAWKQQEGNNASTQVSEIHYFIGLIHVLKEKLRWKVIFKRFSLICVRGTILRLL